MELPPRARRIPLGICASKELIGTTSACAENANAPNLPKRCHQNYLRVRGEYKRSQWLDQVSSELPPRTRRILIAPFFTRTTTGTTSACAENTPILCRFQTTIRNYLRVRGEYTIQMNSSYKHREPPPRARRIPSSVVVVVSEVVGTTSACAENTVHNRRFL